MQNSFVFRF